MHPRAPLFLFVLAAVGLAGCTSGSSPYACTGECAPTVEGASGVPYASYDEARLAFTRSDKEGSFIATGSTISSESTPYSVKSPESSTTNSVTNS